MPPQSSDNHINIVGKCNFRGNEREFGIRKKDRRQHMYIIGKTGTGKTTLSENLVLQDIQAGHGLAVIDPHGEFAERVMRQIPAWRAKDVVYFNPVDHDFPIGFNILEVPDIRYKHLVVSDLLGIFTKIWANVWSARMEYILQNCILALIDTPGTTLLGIPRILVDKQYRERIVANVKDPVVRSFWVHEYETWRDQFRNEAIVPIQNKVGQFLNTSFIRNIVGQEKSKLNIPDIMNSGKILLVNVSKGKIGEDNSALLGAMIITKIQLAAMERVRIPEEQRRDFYMYVDEFQNFATDSFASILSEARKYRLNLIIAHQYIGQLVTDTSEKVKDAVFGNVGTMIVFRVGATDSEFLEKEFEPEFMMQDLINLPNFHIYLKLMVDGLTSRPFSATTLPPLDSSSELAKRLGFDFNFGDEEAIINTSRSNYASSREEVERAIAVWGGAVDGAGEETGAFAGGGAGSAQKYPAVCWNCGRQTTVPFRPDGKRPVYCEQCFKLIEDGKLIPLPERMPQVGKAKYSSTLGDLGIEFEGAEGMRGGQPEQRDRPGDEQYRRPFPREDRRDFRPDHNVRPDRNRSEVARAEPTSRQFSSRDDRRPAPHRERFERNQRNSELLRDDPRHIQEDRHVEHARTRRDTRPQSSRYSRSSNEPPSMRPPIHGTNSQPLTRTAPPEGKRVSLGELKSEDGRGAAEEQKNKPQQHEQSSQPPSHRSVDVSGLRGILEEFLTDNSHQNKPSPPQKTDVSPSTTNESPGILKPGDTVKF